MHLSILLWQSWAAPRSSDKIGIISKLLESADHLLIGGAMAYTFLKAQGIETGTSLTEDDRA